jgi:hypothetical protein
VQVRGLRGVPGLAGWGSVEPQVEPAVPTIDQPAMWTRSLHYEMAPTTALPQPLVSALTAVLDCSVRDIEASSNAQISALRAFLDSRWLT